MARKINTCGHPDREHRAHGRCNICYKKWKSSLEDTPVHVCIDCGKKYITGKGSANRCHTHYLLFKRRTDLEYFIRERYWSISKRVNSVEETCHYGLSTCSFEEFREFSINDEGLLRLWTDWKDRDYSLSSSPSIDRVDKYKGYDLGNLQWTTQGENSSKDRKTPIRAYKDGQLIGDYSSKKEAGEALGVHPANIYKVYTGLRRSTGGYTFEKVSNE